MKKKSVLLISTFVLLFSAIAEENLTIPEILRGRKMYYNNPDGIIRVIYNGEGHINSSEKWELVITPAVDWIIDIITKVGSIPKFKHRPLDNYFPTETFKEDFITFMYETYPFEYERVILDMNFKEGDKPYIIDLIKLSIIYRMSGKLLNENNIKNGSIGLNKYRSYSLKQGWVDALENNQSDDLLLTLLMSNELEKLDEETLVDVYFILAVIK